MRAEDISHFHRIYILMYRNWTFLYVVLSAILQHGRLQAKYKIKGSVLRLISRDKGQIKGYLEPTSIFKIQKLNEQLMILKTHLRQTDGELHTSLTWKHQLKICLGSTCAQSPVLVDTANVLALRNAHFTCHILTYCLYD